MGRQVVLCYHAVSASWDDPLAVAPATLESQVSAVRRRGHAVHVTFDDAYRSVLTAVPLLERLAPRATIFVCSDYARDGRPLDAPELAGLPRHELATLRWEELRELVERGVEIGSHTRTHPNLRTLAGDELVREVKGSREEIEGEVGRKCRYFAYPYGQSDERVARAVEDAGYEGAFALAGVGRPRGRFAVPRVELARDDGAAAIALKTSRAWPLLARPVRRMGNFARARM